MPGAADVNMHLQVTHSGGRFGVNDVPFDPPSVPVLLQVLRGSRTAMDLLPPGSGFPLPRNKTVEISVSGQAGGGSFFVRTYS